MAGTDQIDGPLDISQCDEEPIHLLGKILNNGALLALDDDFCIRAMSENAPEFIGLPISIGASLSDFFQNKAMHAIRGALHKSSITGYVERLLAIELGENSKEFAVAVHHNGTYVVLEIEQVDAFEKMDDDFLRDMFIETRKLATVEDLFTLYTLSLRRYTGFDRVMIYQFLEDGSGEVVAESKSAKLEAYQGLRYPSSDIPKQARRLYLQSTLRIIPDVSAPTVDIVTDERASSIDLTKSQLRAVSDVHIQYLKNMGVVASMSISIVINEQLWGLIACHHGEAAHPAVAKRIQLDLFAQMVALEISHRQATQQRTLAIEAQEVYSKIITRVNTFKPAHLAIFDQLPYMQSVIPCVGIALHMQQQTHCLGHTLSKEAIWELMHVLDSRQHLAVEPINCLSELLQDSSLLQEGIAGVLVVALSKRPGDYIFFFRRAQTEKVHWAGNPEKMVERIHGHKRLMPRTSFEIWSEEHQDRSKPWSESEIRLAHSLRVGLMESAIRHLREKEELQLQAAEQRELLIRELNHRVRNILNLVNAVISQTNVEGRNIDEFVKVLSSRIKALASAHDQLMESVRKNVSLREILRTEVQAYNNTNSGIELTGPDVNIQSDAVTPLVLVIHELFTNAVKHGALSAQSEKGQVLVNWSVLDNGLLRLNWQEKGGPLVTTPNKNGFGMTIVKTVIPYELGGECELEFHPEGLRVSIDIPGKFFAKWKTKKYSLGQELEQQASENNVSSEVVLPACTVLIAEDNLLIALDMQKKLKEQGVSKCEIAASVQQGLNVLAANDVQFAILDVYLGDEVSFPLAAKLLEIHIPFCFVTGYGPQIDEKGLFKDAPVYVKPLSDGNFKDIVKTIKDREKHI